MSRCPSQDWDDYYDTMDVIACEEEKCCEAISIAVQKVDGLCDDCADYIYNNTSFDGVKVVFPDDVFLSPAARWQAEDIFRTSLGLESLPMPRTKEQLAEIDALRARVDAFEPQVNMLTPDEFFASLPEGNFESPEAWGYADAHPLYDADLECEWYRAYYYEELGRQDGKRWLNLVVQYECGDTEDYLTYDERAADRNEFSDPWEEVYGSYARRIDRYFQRWARYNLWVAEFGYDPLEEYFDKPTYERAMEAAKQDIRYLYKEFAS